MPIISEMGWIGEELSRWMNPLFAMENPIIEEEMRLMGTPAAARADVFAMKHSSFEDDGDRGRLFTDIDEGSIGYVYNGVRYLKAEEILGA